MLKLRERPFLEIANLFFLVALFVASIWDFLFRADHPISSLVVGGCVVIVFVLGYVIAFRRRN